jgi:nicotinate-nucleotide pyrophosphorylase
MDAGMIKTAVRAVKEEAARAGRSVLTEASGGQTFDQLAELRDTGVDRVSTSAITLALPVDIGLDEA